MRTINILSEKLNHAHNHAHRSQIPEIIELRGAPLFVYCQWFFKFSNKYFYLTTFHNIKNDMRVEAHRSRLKHSIIDAVFMGPEGLEPSQYFGHDSRGDGAHAVDGLPNNRTQNLSNLA